MVNGGEDGTRASSRRKALLVAYYWPPAGGPGVQRWLKFAKYIGPFGWDLTVLVPSGAAYPVVDPSLEEEVSSDLKVIHVPIFEPYEAIQRLMPSKPSERLGSGGGQAKGLGKVLLWLRGNVLLPDPRVLWRKRAVRAGLKALSQAEQERQPFDALITTGPPHSVHLIGLDLKRQTQLPWLADFRDLWREMDYLEDFLPTSRTRRRHLELEGLVVRAADTVTITSPSVRASLALHLGESAGDKCQLVYNGWDEEDMVEGAASKAPETAPPDGPFRLGHFGSLFPTRDAPALWQAIRNANAQGAGRPIHLDIVGKISPPVLDSLQRHLLPEDWTHHGYLPHQEAVRMMADMDALLLIQNNNSTGQRAIPGKAFEYLGTGKPIATIAPSPSDLHDLITEWNLTACTHDDVEGAQGLLKQLTLPFESKPDLAQRYTRRSLSGVMASLLDQMVHSSSN